MHTKKLVFCQDPLWSFGTDKRNTLNTGQKFAHYNRIDVEVTLITN